MSYTLLCKVVYTCTVCLIIAIDQVTEVEIKFTKVLNLKFTSMCHSFQTNVTLYVKVSLIVSNWGWALCSDVLLSAPDNHHIAARLLKLSYTRWRVAFNCMHTLSFRHRGVQLFSMCMFAAMRIIVCYCGLQNLLVRLKLGAWCTTCQFNSITGP